MTDLELVSGILNAVLLIAVLRIDKADREYRRWLRCLLLILSRHVKQGSIWMTPWEGQLYNIVLDRMKREKT